MARGPALVRRGRKANHSASVRWRLAVEIAGGERALMERARAAGLARRTVNWWRSQDRVPASRLLPFLLERYLEARRPAKRRA